MRSLGMLVLILVAAGCAATDTEGGDKKKEDVITTKSGLKYVELKAGNGQVAKAGDTVEVHYVGTLASGKKFDSSRDRNEPFSFKLGAGMVIKGWEEGIAGIKEGGQRKLIIPPELAYGNRDVGNGLIPANSTLIFEVELIKVRLERVKVDSTISKARIASRQAVIRLLEKLAIADTTDRAVAGELGMKALSLDFNSLRQLALNERADVRAAMAEVNAASQRVALERARAKPDISPFAGYKRVGNDNTVLAGVNIPLKVRDSNQAEIARAETDVRSAGVRLQLARNHASAEVESALAGLQATRELVDTFEKELLRQADESSSITLAAYEEGGTELLPVLEAQRTRTEVRQEYFKTLFDYQASVVALELAVGREVQP